MRAPDPQYFQVVRLPSTAIRPFRRASSSPFEDFYRQEFPRLAGSLYMACGDRALAEEISQEAFARALNHWSRVATMDRPNGWLYRVAFNQLRREWKRTKRDGEFQMSLRQQAVAATESNGERADLVNALGQLPLEQATAVVLRHVMDYSTDDAAHILKVSPGALRMTLLRAMKTLRQMNVLTPDQYEDNDES